jgi:hypothetical protein
MENIKVLLDHFKDKYVQIYIGDQYEEIQQFDFSQTINGTIYGKLLDISGEFLILDCFYYDNRNLKSGNIIFVNSWHIKVISEIKKEGSISDVLLSVEDINVVKKLIGL